MSSHRYSTTLTLCAILLLIPSTLFGKSRQTRCDTVATELEALGRTPIPGFWKRYAALFAKKRICIGESEGEETSDLTIHWLAERWSAISELSGTSPRFREFVVSCANTTVGDDRLSAVETLARDKCPEKLRGFCASLLAEARRSLQEMREQGLVCEKTLPLNENVIVTAVQAGCLLRPTIIAQEMVTDRMLCVTEKGKRLTMSKTFTLRNPRQLDLSPLCDPHKPRALSLTGKFILVRGDVPDNDTVAFEVRSR
jgi:hypothetical protein